MNGSPEPVVLQGLNFEATGKIAGIGNLPLSPGARPFVTVINSGKQEDPNAFVSILEVHEALGEGFTYKQKRHHFFIRK